VLCGYLDAVLVVVQGLLGKRAGLVAVVVIARDIKIVLGPVVDLLFDLL
jgi:hypothetical protein